MKTQIILSTLLSFFLHSAFGQASLLGSIDTIQLSNNCELRIPKLCDPYDIWRLEANCEMDSFKLNVFNRWGEKIYSADSTIEEGYDLLGGGELKRNLPHGEYFWTIHVEIEDLEINPINGSVQVIQFLE